MEPLGLNEIRERYLNFFEHKAHLRLPSFPLVPQNDPSILLINAGMTPLKPFFTGAQTPPSLRITTCQKCIRTPDIDNVGQTARHGTYFEMLGNFSFGDYFKKEAIPWAWEFCTKVLEMPEDRLYPSVYEEDDEAYAIWRDDVGVPEDRITRLGKADNFWEHGTGPCGPCSEIYFDRGEKYGCGSADCKVGCECDRFVEFWNLVFTQYNREEDGTYTPLQKKNIDTGGGLERFACIMQGVDNLFEVDTIRSILDKVCELSGVVYGKNQKDDVAIRVITDHARSSTMMISDGVLPSNEGRGYVLRRLMRRAARFGRLLGIKDLFLTQIADQVIEQNKEAYPSLIEKRSYIMTVIRKEEEAFARTVEQGSSILQNMIEAAQAQGLSALSGEDVFRLHDTYGFPLDLTREIAKDAGLTVDEAGFTAQMKKQKDAARAATKAKTDTAWGGKELPQELLSDREATDFVGYDELVSKGIVRYIIKEDEEGALQLVPEAFSGDKVVVIFDKTSFYATSGGQTHDIGTISANEFCADVISVDKDASGKFLHSILIKEGAIRQGETVDQNVDVDRRLSTARHHTTTHILQKALRDVLGDHVEQSGSMVSDERLRFDFTHFQALTQEELESIEHQVNEVILRDEPVMTHVMTQDQARAMGAMALFGEKYGDTVRVITVGSKEAPYSMELCGGTHLTHSGQAGMFRILSESGIASGVRRIEAVTGRSAIALAKSEHEVIKEMTSILKATPDQLAKKVIGMAAEIKTLEKQLEQVREAQCGNEAQDLAQKAESIAGVDVVVAEIQAESADALRDTADKVRDRMDKGVVVLAAVQADKLMFVVMASPKAVSAGIHSGTIVKAAATAAGGGGGGRPDMAQAGGKNLDALPQALSAAKAEVNRQLGV